VLVGSQTWGGHLLFTLLLLPLLVPMLRSVKRTHTPATTTRKCSIQHLQRISFGPASRQVLSSTLGGQPPPGAGLACWSQALGYCKCKVHRPPGLDRRAWRSPSGACHIFDCACSRGILALGPNTLVVNGVNSPYANRIRPGLPYSLFSLGSCWVDILRDPESPWCW